MATELEDLIKDALPLLGDFENGNIKGIRRILSSIKERVSRGAFSSLPKTVRLYREFIQALAANYYLHWKNLCLNQDHQNYFLVFFGPGETIDIFWIEKLHAFLTLLGDNSRNVGLLEWISTLLDRLVFDAAYPAIIYGAIERQKCHSFYGNDMGILLEWKEWLRFLTTLPEKVANIMQLDLPMVWNPR
jgi:hypothetical protein